MTEKKIAGITALIDEEATVRFYKKTPLLGEETSAKANFMANIHLRKSALEAFANPLGLDMRKCAYLTVSSVDPYLQSVSYSGYYILCGDIPNMAELGDPEDFNSAWYSWEQTACGFDFSYAYTGHQLILDFIAELPWLFNPPIAEHRYINKTKLPDEWNSIPCLTYGK